MAEVVADVKKRIQAGESSLDKMRIFIENHMGLLECEAGLIEVLQVELRQSSKFLKDYTPVKFFEYLDVLSGILEEGKREGVFRPDLNVNVARRVVFGAMEELSRTYILSKRQKFHPSVTSAEVFQLLAEGFCAKRA
jgi:TetR/AcrR family fatty acid metabolism transcriptional regulator